ncbi:MAG: hypothetical protein QRY74_04645 [Chlamydia sp.]
MNNKFRTACLLWIFYSCFFIPPFQTGPQDAKDQIGKYAEKEVHSIVTKNGIPSKKTVQLLLHNYREAQSQYTCEFCGWKCNSAQELQEHQAEYH